MEYEQCVSQRNHLIRTLQNMVHMGTHDPQGFLVRYEDIDIYRKEFRGLQTRIQKLLNKKKDFSAEVTAAEIESRELFDNYYYDIQKIGKQLMPRENNGSGGSEQVQSSSSNVRLPKISLSHFSGNVTMFIGFKNMFQSLIHTNERLNKIEKFSYLLSCLEGEPLSLVNSLPLTESNYDSAWSLLLERYANERVIATTHLDYILDLPTLQSTNNISMQARHIKTIVNTVTEHLMALENLDFPVNQWDFVIFNIVSRKLNTYLRREFENSLSHPTSIPKLRELIDFLKRQISMHDIMGLHSFNVPSPPEATGGRTVVTSKGSSNKAYRMQSLVAQSPTNKNGKNHVCELCDKKHSLSNCPVFLKLSPKQRHDKVIELKRCFKCLSNLSFHSAKDCTANNCSICNFKHSDLLHFDREVLKADDCDIPKVFLSAPSPKNEVPVNSKYVLLGTALVKVYDQNGSYVTLRAILDVGSQISAVSECAVQRLGLSRKNTPKFSIGGIGQSNCQNVRGITSLKMRSCDQKSPGFTVNALILPSITGLMPSERILSNSWTHISNIKLADPTFNVPNKVDLLLGADIYASLLRDGRLVGDAGTPTAINTALGWVLIGQCDLERRNVTSLHCIANSDFDLRQFWLVEECPAVRTFTSPEDVLCEEHFMKTHSRDENGRYIVRLTFKPDAPILGSTREQALSRLQNLEKRFKRNPALKVQYVQFLGEYETLGHMSKVDPYLPAKNRRQPFHIPHHCVFRTSSQKIRVVFDAGARSSTGFSLNDTLMKGTKLQSDISTVILRFRLHKIVFTADIRQMYRQFLVHSDDWDSQRILWRENSEDEVSEYHLRTVTYGETSSAFLAIRVLKQLAHDERMFYPSAAQVLENDTYVDDIVTGAASIEDALKLKNDIIQLCKLAGLELQKWSAIKSVLLDEADNNSTIRFDHVDVKILGLRWNPKMDTFSYDVTPSHLACTKRTILSEIARIYDPLGWLSPAIIVVKLIIQQLWAEGVEWDSELPHDIEENFQTFRKELSELSNIQISRCILPYEYQSLELHGFCDSSEKAYGAVVYFRILALDGTYETFLIIGKSRVSPLKRLSLPRLELLGALLLSRLLKFILDTYEHLNIVGTYAWSDSKVTLAWIKSSPHLWQTFIANRVAEIQENVLPNCWHHVSSEENPADCASRGVSPANLKSHPLWWHGPQFLKSPLELKNEQHTTATEMKVKALLISSEDSNAFEKLIEKFSRFKTLKKVTACCLRFIHNCRCKLSRKSGVLSVMELRKAQDYLVKVVQNSEFANDSVTLQIGTLVLIKDENIPPLQWRLGRIVELHLGPDNRVRVASIRLAWPTIVKRPVVKLCPLPVEAN